MKEKDGIVYPFVGILCDGQCGDAIYLSVPQFVEHYHVNGDKREGHEDISFLCVDCGAWWTYTDALMDATFANLPKSLPQGDGA